MHVYKIAGLNIGIEANYDFTYKKCNEYLADCATPDFTVSVNSNEICDEQKLSPGCSVEYCEFVCVYREICYKLPLFGRMLIHSAAIEKDGSAYAFAAKSGTGKTTHIRLWKELYQDSVNIINGDKPIFIFNSDSISVCGTPWCGKEDYSSNIQVPLKALCFIERGTENSICALEKERAVNKLFRQILIPHDAEAAAKTLELCSKLIDDTPIYELKCNISLEAAKTAYEIMSGFIG